MRVNKKNEVCPSIHASVSVYVHQSWNSDHCDSYALKIAGYTSNRFNLFQVQ